METTECNEATFPFLGHRDSPPSLLSLGAHTQASSPSPPCTQQHTSFLLFLVLLFCSLLSASLLHHLLVLCLPPQQFLHPFLVFRLDLSVDPLLKIIERWRGLQKMQLLQNKNHARCHMTQTTIPHHLVHAALMKCRLKRKIGTHPISLPIRVLFIGLSYLARIAAKAHGH